MTMSSTTSAKLVLEGLTKTFQGQRALSEVSLELRAGEIHCLLGQNGSGKSTLIKILAGYHSPDHGSALIDGRPMDLGSPAEAHSHGLRFIHQDLALIDSLSVVDNLALGESYGGRYWLSDRRERRIAQDIFAEYGVDIQVGRPLGALGSASQAMTAIVRALHHGDAARGILVLDEPTASLSEPDKEHLFELLRAVKARGGTMLYVTHRLHEVFELADRVTVLRDGRNVATREVGELNPDSLIELILGRPMDAVYPEPPHPGSDRVLEMTDLGGGALTSFSGTVRAGEIVGVVGLAGSGADEIPQLIFGATPRRAGEIRLNGKPIAPGSPWEAIRSGIALVPADRKRLGVIADWTLRENVTLPKVRGRGPLRWLSRRREAGDVASYMTQCEVKPNDPEATISSLSGGNQQKIMIARWLRAGAKVLLLQEPTAGVDVGSRSAIYRHLNQAASEGASVLITTTDLEEACAVCDRVYVVRGGRLGAELDASQLTPDTLLGEVLRPSHDSTALDGQPRKSPA
ncbi:sugar ABC transporter ATP-binding protein (plasmid) [Nocardioides sp. R1-1]|uniref:sugar ABC transporter ATP-binding protein n=1 Tax=Nocardioides sp. R1-1 TaxID=3383502 RepID=UPI0038D0E156